MKSLSPQAKRSMARIFNLVNMSELPALSDNVHELLDMIGDEHTNAKQLSGVILKDVSLTSKVLQVVNSAYYTRGTQVGSVCRAITLIGFNTIREMAMSIALFEDFIRAGGDRVKVSDILTRSFLSGTLSKEISIKNSLHVSHEEAFICGLFHNLGELIVLIYLPDLYRKVAAKIDGGVDKNQAARAVLDDLTFYQVGMEIAVFWNLCEKIVYSMHPDPPKLRHPDDDFAMLMNLSAFSNQLTAEISDGGNKIDRLFERYGPILQVDKKKVFWMLEDIIDAAGNISSIIRAGIRHMKLQSKLIVVTKDEKGKYVRLS